MLPNEMCIRDSIDLVASRYGVFCQGCDEVALTLLDVLDYMDKIPMVTAYKLTDGSTTTRFPMGEALDLSLIHISVCRARQG